MNFCDKNPIKKSGRSPQSINITTEQMLLYAAWAHGIKTNDVIHRYILFCFIQTHLSNKSEEALQKTIEDSLFFKHVGGSRSGEYILTEKGFYEIKKNADYYPDKVSLNVTYIYTRMKYNRVFSVEVSPLNNRSKMLVPKVNGNEVDAYSTLEKLEELGEYFKSKNTNSQNSKLLRWIIQDNNFVWERIENSIGRNSKSLLLS